MAASHAPPHTHTHSHSHAHDAGSHGHTHEILDGPGSFLNREMPVVDGRDWNDRAFTIGIGGEDAEFLTRNKALSPERIRAIETGGCPHAAVREDISANLLALQQLQRKFQTDLLLIESGGDNLAANYSRELADYIIYVIDVAGGDKIPRKGGPGITGSDLLVVNKTDLAEAVGADLAVMERDAAKMREGGPTIFAEVKNGRGVEHIVNLIVSAWKTTEAYEISLARWKNGAPKTSGPV
ncbi:hypothetical protein LOZ58_002408 [Ophidiomyces ophidiicola]|nr:hypothetical protein LOZ65_003148 [Ophidiomyces ophidiicola]KAI1936765.1 hypothetical protein LOZ66_004269 [Ophidiomyces ophidiicola]KAI1962788.1 hypothetical protein LOZ58_002408 [Ophidiomyces ophidiicola]